MQETGFPFHAQPQTWCNCGQIGSWLDLDFFFTISNTPQPRGLSTSCVSFTLLHGLMWCYVSPWGWQALMWDKIQLGSTSQLHLPPPGRLMWFGMAGSFAVCSAAWLDGWLVFGPLTACLNGCMISRSRSWSYRSWVTLLFYCRSNNSHCFLSIVKNSEFIKIHSSEEPYIWVMNGFLLLSYILTPCCVYCVGVDVFHHLLVKHHMTLSTDNIIVKI